MRWLTLYLLGRVSRLARFDTFSPAGPQVDAFFMSWPATYGGQEYW